MTWRGALFVLLACGCGTSTGAGTEPRSGGEIVIPAGSTRDRGDEAPPARADPIETVSRDDPYLYFVGNWEGLVNEKLTTSLAVTDDGRFHIHLPLQKHRPACDLWGKLRVSDRVVYFDIDHSTCEAESVGTTLERHVVTKTDDEMVVRAADSKMMVRYKRQKEP